MLVKADMSHDAIYQIISDLLKLRKATTYPILNQLVWKTITTISGFRRNLNAYGCLRSNTELNRSSFVTIHVPKIWQRIRHCIFTVYGQKRDIFFVDTRLQIMNLSYKEMKSIYRPCIFIKMSDSQ